MKTMISMLLYFYAAASVNVRDELFIHRCLESDVQQTEPSKSFSQQHFRGPFSPGVRMQPIAEHY